MKHALRSLAKSPGFTATAVLTLAIGIGACTAIFSIVNSVLLRPVAYPDSERIVVLHEVQLPQRSHHPASPASFLEWTRATDDIFESMYALLPETFNVTGPGTPARVRGVRATSRYFETLRSGAMLGRVFDPADETAGRSRIAVLSHGFWTTHFGGRPDVVGQDILLNGWSLEIIGVMPPDFQRDELHDLFVPLTLSGDIASLRHDHFLSVGARLKQEVTLEAAAARMDVLSSHLAEQFSGSNRDWSVSVTPLLYDKTFAVRRPLHLAHAAVGVLLLIACANVSGLMLVRTSRRQRELSIRAALGAGRWQIVRQLLAESLLLAVGAGVLGLLLGQWTLDAFLSFAPADLPRAAEVTMDARAMGVALGVTVLTGLTMGIVPALHRFHLQPGDALKTSTRHATDSHRAHLIRDGLVVAQIALALILLAGAGLLIRSFIKLAAFDPGFKPHGAIAVEVAFPWRKYDTSEKQIAVADAVMNRYRTLAGVTHVSTTTVLPLTAQDGLKMEIESDPRSIDSLPRTSFFAISAGYFETLGIRHVRGRDFTAGDRPGTPAVAIISQSAAEQYFGGTDPIGRRLRLHDDGPATWREIVGVVADVKSSATDAQTKPQVYVPFAQMPSRFMTFVVRTAHDPALMTSALRRDLLQIDSEQPVGRLESLPSMLSSAIAQHRFTMRLTTAFSLAALALAAIGIYAAVAYTVTQRTSEFGIRMALGALPRDIVKLVLARSTRVVLAGIALGLLGALATLRLLGSMLFDVSAQDPLTFVAISALLFAIALPACLLPARRATKVDPLTALRSE